MLEKRFELLWRMLKGIEVIVWHYTDQNFSYTIPFLLDRLLEIEWKYYLFHTLPT